MEQKPDFEKASNDYADKMQPAESYRTAAYLDFRAGANHGYSLAQSELSSAQEKNERLLKALKDVCDSDQSDFEYNISEALSLISEIENKQ